MIKYFCILILTFMISTIEASAEIPGGRLVASPGPCQSAHPIQTLDVPSTGTLCYVPFVNNQIVIGGTEISFNPLTLSLSAAVAGKIYDVFAVLNGGNPALCIGPAWNSSTARAVPVAISGDGVTYYANLQSCYNGNVNYGTLTGIYLGSVYTPIAGATSWLLSPYPVVNGTNNVLGVYNAYHRVRVTAIEREGTPIWAYGNPQGSWQMEHNSPGNRITFIDGMGESQVFADMTMTLSFNVGSDAQAGSPGMCADCETPGTVIGMLGQGSYTTYLQGGCVRIAGPWSPGLGVHFVQGITSGQSAHSDGPAWYGSFWSSLQITLDN